MRIIRIIAVTLVSYVCAVSTASAESSVGVGVSNVGGDGLNFTGGALDVTGRFSDNFGWSIASQIGGSDGIVDLEYFIAGKLRAGFPVGGVEGGFLFLTAGYAGTSLEAFGSSVSGDDFIYGVGFEGFFGSESKWGYGLEYNGGAGEFSGLDQVMGTIRYRF